jgi:hypothetical protein
MYKMMTFCLGAVALTTVLLAGTSTAADHTWSGKKALWFARQTPWHAQYAHPQYGQPVALVVPPCANAQTHWGWGVGNMRMSPIYHQFDRPYPGESVGAGCPFYPVPRWPSSTDQMGVYPIRAPW